MLDHRAKTVRAAVEQVLVGRVMILQQVVPDDPFVKRSSGHRAVDEELGQRRLQSHQCVQFLGHDFLVLVIEPHDHRSQHGDAMLAELAQNLGDRPALLLGVIGSLAFVPDPEAVDAHLENFFNGMFFAQVVEGRALLRGEGGKPAAVMEMFVEGGGDQALFFRDFLQGGCE